MASSRRPEDRARMMADARASLAEELTSWKDVRLWDLNRGEWL
jgi:hypothetical protein